MFLRKRFFIIQIFFIFMFNIAYSSEDVQISYSNNLSDLSQLSFNELGNIVTSVSKRPENSFHAPAAVYVITQEDIKHSGLLSIPEILRMVPGLQVASLDPAVWAVTSRGFNYDGFGNKLLVLIDGRTVYTPLFSGVNWDVQDTYIEDIERIEVIRGPGASLWGANAVNGVINIVTKKASDTQTKVVTVGAGKESESFMETRYGGSIGKDSFYRVFLKRTNTDQNESTVGIDGGNNWYMNRGGFRFDSAISNNQHITIQGDVYYGNENVELFLPASIVDLPEYRNDNFRATGGNLLFKWNKQHNSTDSSYFQTFIDYASSNYTLLEQENYTFDMEYQYSKKINNRHFLVAGLGYRYITDNLRDSKYITYDTVDYDRVLYNSFIQDTIHFDDPNIDLTLGTKIEHNRFTGFEIQPTAKLSWLVNKNNNIWASYSRAVRTPSRSENSISLVLMDGFVRSVDNKDFESEILNAYEVGYRTKPVNNLSIDSTAFLNIYDKLRTLEETFSGLPGDTVAGYTYKNLADAKTYGFEIASKWNVKDYWTLKGSYSYILFDIEKDTNSTDIFAEHDKGAAPRNQFNISSQLYLPYSIEFSNNLYYVDNLNSPYLNIPSYIRFDSRVAWQPKPGVEVALVGQNLFDDKHNEFGSSLHGVPGYVERNYYGKLTFRF